MAEDVCSWTIVNEGAKLSDVMMKFWVPRSQGMHVRSSDYILSYFWKTLKVFKQEVKLTYLFQRVPGCPVGKGLDEVMCERKGIRKLFH